MLEKKSFTITELLVVIIIIGILAALALPNYLAIKEKSLNREAKASLALIRAAERIYRMEQGYYYPQSASTSNISDINSYLKLALPASGPWSVSLDSTAAPESAVATRSAGPDAREWKLEFQNETPGCTGGTGTPSSCL
jgi:prepilin-type N-terminal cleavage/methylation domain-containing protein